MELETLFVIGMFLTFGALLMTGYPVAWVLGGTAVIWTVVGVVAVENFGANLWFDYQSSMGLVPERIWKVVSSETLVALPMFIFMGIMLDQSGVAERLMNSMVKLVGAVRGGYAVTVIVIGVLLAATTGIIGASVVLLGMLSLPVMMENKYDKGFAVGTACATGTLGILIPPSILAILYAVVAQQSVGELYLGSLLPGLLLSGLYLTYVLVRSWINPKLGPPIPPEDRISLKEKVKLLGNLIAPLALVGLVLGLLFGGIATPVEAAGIGSFGAIIVAMMHKKFSIAGLREASVTTAKASAMVLWIMFGASVFVGFYILQGGQQFVTDAILGTGMSAYGILFLLMVLLVVLGMFLDWVGILLLAVPIFIPIVKALEFPGLFGFPPVAGDDVVLWFGVLYLVNMQMSFLSPPFGYALFYIRGVCPPEISMGTIFKSSLVFLAIQAFGLFMCVLIPGIVTWLPGLVYG